MHIINLLTVQNYKINRKSQIVSYVVMKVEILQKLYNKEENSLNVSAKNYGIDDVTDNEGGLCTM